MTKKLCLMAMYTAAALVIFVAEAQLPPLTPLPGIKLGLANIITLAAMLTVGKREAAMILAVRIVLGNIVTGQPTAMLYSFAGAIPSYAVSLLMLKLTTESQIWAVSAAAAVFHSLGQLAAAAVVAGTWSVFWYAPALTLASVISGVFTGLAVQYYIKHVKRR